MTRDATTTPRTSLSDVLERTRQKVELAKAGAGRHPQLVGYDVNAIQAFVTGNSRPVAMQGASHIITSFDEEMRARPGCLYTGGGRGKFLLSEDDAATLADELPRLFRASTLIGTVGVATAPVLAGDEAAALRLLHCRLQIAKDAALPAEDEPPGRKQDLCPRCRTYEATERENKRADADRICRYCFLITDAGRDEQHDEEQDGISLSDLAATNGVVAAISADGNNMGQLFGSLNSLAGTAAVSTAVAWLFRAAHEAAIAAAGLPAAQFLAPVTGGDDVRVFLAPQYVEPYVTRLAAEIEAGANLLGNLGGVLTAEESGLLSQIGIGIGVVASPAQTSSRWMLGRAHLLEDKAKELCRAKPCRSAVALAWLSADEPFDEQNLTAAKRGEVAIDLGGSAWHEFVRRTQALQKIPPSQLTVLAEQPQLTGAEFANLFRYQLARSKPWRTWYQEIGEDWQDSAQVMAHVPQPTMLDLLRMVASA